MSERCAAAADSAAGAEVAAAAQAGAAAQAAAGGAAEADVAQAARHHHADHRQHDQGKAEVGVPFNSGEDVDSGKKSLGKKFSDKKSPPNYFV